MSPTVISERSAYNLNGQRVVPFEVAAKLETERGELLEALKLSEQQLRAHEILIDSEWGGCRSNDEFEAEDLWGAVIKAVRAAIAKAQS